jgi:hypothetical protein
MNGQTNKIVVLNIVSKKKSKLTENSLAEKCWAFLNKFKILLSHHTLCHVGVITKNSEFLVLVDP